MSDNEKQLKENYDAYLATEEGKDFIAGYSSAGFEKISLAVDLVLFTIQDGTLKTALITRDEEPYKGQFSLPGVFVGMRESFSDAVRRGIQSKAGLENIYFEQLYTWGSLYRDARNADPGTRIISLSYLAVIRYEQLNTTAQLFSCDEIKGMPLAFDHSMIIEYGRERLKNKAEYAPEIAAGFLPEEFTLPQLQRVYEILLDKPLYKANFRKKIEPYIEDTEKMTSGEAHRPSKLYRMKK